MGQVTVQPPAPEKRGLCDFFFKNRRWCFLSLLVVTPPCHSWLSLLLVALTGGREKEENLNRRAISPVPFEPDSRKPACSLTIGSQ